MCYTREIWIWRQSQGDCFAFLLCTELWTFRLGFNKQDLQLTGFQVTIAEIKDMNDLGKIEYSCFVRVLHKQATRSNDSGPALPFVSSKKHLYTAPKNNQYRSQMIFLKTPYYKGRKTIKFLKKQELLRRSKASRWAYLYVRARKRNTKSLV